MNNEEKKIALRFTVILEVLDFQAKMFARLLQGTQKNQYNIMMGHMDKFRQELQKAFDAKSTHYLDNKASLVWEIIDEIEKADDPRKIWLVAKAYNDGLVAFSDDLDTPANQIAYDTLMKKEEMANV